MQQHATWLAPRTALLRALDRTFGSVSSAASAASTAKPSTSAAARSASTTLGLRKGSNAMPLLAKDMHSFTCASDHEGCQHRAAFEAANICLLLAC